MGINREPKSMFYLLLNETFVYDVPALSNIIRPMVNLQKTKESIAFDLFLHLLRVSSTIFLWTWLWQISCFLRLSPRSTS